MKKKAKKPEKNIKGKIKVVTGDWWKFLIMIYFLHLKKLT